MKITFHKNFRKQYKKAPSEIQNVIDKRLVLFQSNPIHPLLRNHALTGQYQGCRSINITGDWRAIYQESETSIIIFLTIGTHSKLYK